MKRKVKITVTRRLRTVTTGTSGRSESTEHLSEAENLSDDRVLPRNSCPEELKPAILSVIEMIEEGRIKI